MVNPCLGLVVGDESVTLASFVGLLLTRLLVKRFYRRVSGISCCVERSGMLFFGGGLDGWLTLKSKRKTLFL